ncbi:hypothetical protein KY284_030463 [Solanum tuberosum]|nr:hypothetical protein KY284_030463 [Solanum tuberosum]
MMNPLPSMDQAFALLVQEEKQREFKPNNFQNFQTNYTNSGTKTRLLCDYYKRLGHIKDKCYNIDGYPNNSGLNNQSYTNHAQRNQQNNFNPNSQNIGYKGKGIVTNVHGDLHASYSNERSQVNTQNGPTSLSKEHYNHLVSMLQHFQGGNMQDGFVADSIPTNRAANFAGPFTEEVSGDW